MLTNDPSITTFLLGMVALVKYQKVCLVEKDGKGKD